VYISPLFSYFQAEISQVSAQAEDLDLKNSTAERSVKSLKEQIEELQDKLSEETRAKIAASNKMKQLDDEKERLNGQLEDEEEAKTALQNKLVQINQQVRLTCNIVNVPTFCNAWL
jgi:myosin protein heavy chain